MKKTKLSLALACLIGAGSLSGAGAAGLDELVKDVEATGMLRYHYYVVGGDERKYQVWGGDVGKSTNLIHNWRSDLLLSAAISDNLRVALHPAWGGGTGTGGFPYNAGSVGVREAYFTYTNADLATKLILGRQSVNTKWTDSSIFRSGFGKDAYTIVWGDGATLINNSIEGVTLSAFGFDSINAEHSKNDNGSYSSSGSSYEDQVGMWVMKKNLYGARASLDKLDTGSGVVNAKLWLGYLTSRATMWAVDLNYGLDLGDGMSYSLTGSYLGNAVAKWPTNNNWANGGYYLLEGNFKLAGLGLTLGGVRYGNESKKTFTILEDAGQLDTVGWLLPYTNGSKISGDVGLNNFGYVGLSYSFLDAFNVYANAVYGTTKVNKNFKYMVIGDKGVSVELTGQGGKKFEWYVGGSYAYSPKLNLALVYTNLQVTRKSTGTANRHVGRFQALYKF